VVNDVAVPDDPQPTYEQLAVLVAAQGSTIARLEAEHAATVTRLEGEIAELKRQLGRTSRNSSQPPSADSPFVKPAPKSLRGKSGRKQGGQAGHQGSTLELVDDPAQRLRREPGPCAGCGGDLGGAPEVGMARRQVFDLPEIEVGVTEYQLIKRRCGCGTVTCGQAPAGVSAPVQYGPRVTAIVLYLYVGQFLSKNRAAQALSELFGTPLSQATVSAMTRRAAGGLGEFTERVADAIAAAPVAGFDETGLRVAGTLQWVHCARTGKYTLITCHPKRGVEAMKAAGVLPRFRGVAVHDAWAPYDTYTAAAHQLCCAHVLRELAAVADSAPAGQDWCWATQAADAVVTIEKLSAAANEAGTAIDPGELAHQIHLYRSAAHLGIAETATRATTVMKTQNALARRLIARQADYLRFTTNPDIPPDNNGSERDIRMIKLRQKVSGCLRTLTGAQQFCTIRSYLSTAAKHGRATFETLVMLAEGRAWLPA